jgi:hypothetical protein
MCSSGNAVFRRLRGKKALLLLSCTGIEHDAVGAFFALMVSLIDSVERRSRRSPRVELLQVPRELLRCRRMQVAGASVCHVFAPPLSVYNRSPAPPFPKGAYATASASLFSIF